MNSLGRLLAAALVVSFSVPSSAGVLATSPSPAPIVLEPITESGYGISSVVPVGWKSVSPGVHARAQSPSDPTIIAIQAAPVSMSDLWPALLPQLQLTSAPKPLGTHTSPSGVEWTLYHVAEGSSGVAVDLALSEQDGQTWLVLLQALTTEIDTLHDAVFLPAVDAYAAVVAHASPAGSGAPTPYADEEVSFPGGASDVTLAGTLSLPAGNAPLPAIVLVTGSGPQDRDESVAPLAAIKPFAIIADALARAGVAVLRFDDRGTAKSTGDYAKATVSDFTADAAAAVAYLRTRPDIDHSRIGLLGHSEGGLDVAEIAAADPAIAFVVGMAPPATSGVDLLVQQNEAILRVQGTAEVEIAPALQFARDVYARAIAGDKPGAEQVIRDYSGALYDRQTPEVQQQLGDRAAYLQSQVDVRMPTLFTPWFVSLLESDAGKAWAKVHAPVLGLFGGKDVQVPAREQAPALEAALKAAGNTSSTVTTLPDANHLFQAATTGAVGEYGSLEQAFTADFLPTLVTWVRAHAGVGP